MVMHREKHPDELTILRDEVRRLRHILTELTPGLEEMLRRRGFRIYKKEPSDDLLIPEEKYTGHFYETMGKYSFRLFLRDVIKHQDSFTEAHVKRYATQEVTREYMEYLLEIGLAEPIGEKTYRLKKRPIKSFGETLEWYVSEIFRHDFNLEAVWGVKFKRPKVGGDYDIIAKINGSLLYMEVKSSPPKQIYATEVAEFFNRTEDLNPSVSVFFMDTELRMKDKIVPMFEEEIKKRQGPAAGAVGRMEKELFQIWDRIFIINAKGNIAGNIEKVLSWYFRRKR